MEIEFEGAKLRVYENGTIERWFKKGWVVSGTQTVKGYLIISINQRLYFNHRIIGMVFYGLDINDTKQQIDHINGIRTDNQIDNLRIVNNQQNQFNRTKSKGYTITRNGTYQAEIRVNNKQIRKFFKTEEEAHTWYLEQKAIHHII